MDSKQFKKVYEYLENDKYFYVLVEKSKQMGMTDNKAKLIKEIRNLQPDKDFLRINVDITKVGYCSFKSVPKNGKSNSYMLRESIVNELSGKLCLPISILVPNKDLLFFPIQKIISQEERLKVNLANRAYNMKVKEVEFATKKTPKKIVEWAVDNKKKLDKNATKYEKSLYNSLRKTFKKRIKVQNPYLINGHLYYADIAIPSLKLIIEVDGGYHNTKEQKLKDKQRDHDFKSIGYTTLRYTNEQVVSREGRKNIIQEILSYKSK